MKTFQGFDDYIPKKKRLKKRTMTSGDHALIMLFIIIAVFILI